VEPISKNVKSMLPDIKLDLPASIVVFFVAVPLCLGITLASGAPLFAGLIAGILGGIVLGVESGSVLIALILARNIQLMMGYTKAGLVHTSFPPQ